MATDSPFQRDGQGNVINPPISPEHEQRIAAAANTGDNSAVARVQRDYDQWRRDEIDLIESGGVPTVDGEQRITASPGGETGAGAAGAPVNIDLTTPAGGSTAPDSVGGVVDTLTPEQRAELRAELDRADAETPAQPPSTGDSTAGDSTAGGGAA